MSPRFKSVLLSAIGVVVVVLAAAACQGEPDPSNAKVEVTSGQSPNASVSGTVTYRERIALTPGASLEVSLRDVSLADAAAPLIARQTISDPGQVPIEFKVEYNRDDIDSRNTYAVSARIVESDGRLAFTNDTAYDVITSGNPSKVAMVLVLVQPPPDQVDSGSDWRTWVETPVPVIWANLMPNESELLLRVGYYQSTIEGCARPGSESQEVDGYDIVARVTLMPSPPTSWAIPCDDEVVELDTVEPIGESLETGQTYRVIVNNQVTTTFTLPVPERWPHRDRGVTHWGGGGGDAGESAAPVPAARRLTHAEGRKLFPVQRLRDQAAGVEQNRRGHHPPRGRRPAGRLYPRFARCGDHSASWLRLRAGCGVHCQRELRHHEDICGR